jgi:predicted ATP-grasp superfamily ATP-dependent carboligase
MNMFYSGLGIARSLGEQGVPVIGLTSQRGIYGNFTRYAKSVFCPDSKLQPEALLAFLVRLGQSLGSRGVIFPTRDHDLVFLDRYRAELAPWFSMVIPETTVLEACLDKWQTHLWAQRSEVDTPKCWRIESERDLAGILDVVTYPCILKPLAAHQWRTGRNWTLVGARKAIPVYTPNELLTEYAAIARADKRTLVQELIPGGDDCLVITACYHDANSRWVAGFNTRKLVQIPEGFGTGCIVQAAFQPELFEPTARLLRNMRFTGIAEVEYKWDAGRGKYRLIEINPRPWDQHRLGNACGVDLMYLAYCEHAGLPIPAMVHKSSDAKWIAEDTFVMAALYCGRRGGAGLRRLFQQAKGRRIYAIWSATDPLPFIAYTILRFLPQLAGMGLRFLWSTLMKRLRPGKQQGVVYVSSLEKGGNRG